MQGKIEAKRRRTLKWYRENNASLIRIAVNKVKLMIANLNRDALKEEQDWN